jgi:hypothetical protein
MSYTGNWKIIINSPMGDQESSLALTESENKLTGTQSSKFGSGDIANGVVDGSNASWSIDITQPFAMTLEFSAQLDGNAISGTVKLGSFGESSFKGSRA